MLICRACRTEVDADHGFCPRCGSALAPGGGDGASAAIMVRCGACGEQVEAGMTYCNHCGVELAAAIPAVEAASASASVAVAADAGPEKRSGASGGEERELYRKSNVSYMKDFLLTGVAGSLGILTITTRRIVFEPSLLSLSTITSLFSKKPANSNLEITMDEVTDALPATIFALSIGMDVVAGERKHRFSFGISGSGEAGRAIQLINAHKCG